MKNKLLTSLLFVVVWISAKAHEKADSVLCTIEHEVAEAQVHIRANGKQWSLLWDYIDENNYRMATIKLLSASGGDNIYDYVSSVTISRVANGETSSDAPTQVTHSTLQSSIKLSVDGNSVRIYGGDSTRCLADNQLMCFNGTAGSSIIFRQDKPVKQVQVTKALKYRIDVDNAQFSNREELDKYLRESTDSIEGYWQYLDRDIDAPTTILGGYYELATVRNGDVYDIIYLRGADKYRNLWQEMSVKGHLKSTIFRDNFDMEWIDGSRTQKFDRDVYATFEQNSIMTLHFPLQKSEVRFSRKPR